MSFIDEFRDRTKKAISQVSLKRLAVLFVLAGSIVAAVFAGVYINASAFAAPKPVRVVNVVAAPSPVTTAVSLAVSKHVKAAKLRKSAKAAIVVATPTVIPKAVADGLMHGTFEEVCTTNKDFALCYLQKKSKIKTAKFVQYKIKLKENFWTVAKKYSVDIDTIVGCNPELKDMNARNNQVLLVPDEIGVLHQIKAGESLKTIADNFGIEESDLKNENNTDFFLSAGDIIFIPDASPVELNANISKIYEKRNLFRSPLAGKYTSLMGTRHDPIIQGVSKFHNGVDIRTPIGTWVGAAAAGTVIDAGWSNGYGNYIKIKHANGYSTLYGHLSKLCVHSGQKVKAGSLIAKSGNTGRTTGPHLHFSIFKGDKVMNPLDFLW
jgi:murein DD-endopeptidase MepM/ murein hydrolase activator NlpD